MAQATLNQIRDKAVEFKDFPALLSNKQPEVIMEWEKERQLLGAMSDFFSLCFFGD